MVNEETSDRSWKGKDKEKEIKKRERRKEQREQSGIKHLWEVGAILSASSKSESHYELFQCAKVNGTSQCVHLYKSCLLQGNIVPACFVSFFQPGRMYCLRRLMGRTICVLDSRCNIRSTTRHACLTEKHSHH